MRRIIGNYLNKRKIVWIGKDGKKYIKIIERGVLQWSALGPLLWNITYDSVLRMPTPANCDIVCYADDTLVIMRGGNMRDIINRTNIVVNAVPRKLNWMDLQVAAEKTEAVRFRKKRENKRE